MKRINRSSRMEPLIKTLAITGAAAMLLTACGGNTTGTTAGNSTNSSGNPTGTTTENAQDEKSGKPVSADELPKAMLAGKFESVYTQTTDDFKAKISLDDFKSYAAEFTSGEKELEQKVKMTINGRVLLGWSDDTGQKGIRAVFEDNGKISSFYFLNLRAFPETDQQKSKTIISPPFKGDWFVLWGGTNPLINYHYSAEIQRYAYDFIQAKDGYSYKGDPMKNESYYAFGQDLFAPADGTVVQVVNDVPDNEPGIENTDQPTGNMVVIDTGNGEFIHMMHLLKGSAVVKLGDKLKRGDLIGKCGNSGASSEAHLHLQVSDRIDYATTRTININWEGDSKPVQGETVHGSK